jgi:hypothetical protein
LSHRCAFERDKRHDVYRAQPWMSTSVLPQIDQVDRGGEQGHDRLLHGMWRAREGQHGSVVGFVGRPIEQPDALDVRNSFSDRVHDGVPTAFADVRHALNQGHKAL